MSLIPLAHDICALLTGQAGISWEAVPPHDRTLFAYEEHWEVVVLKLTL